MWSQLLLCCLVGLAFASNTPAWKENSEYTYQVRGRTVASLNEVSNQFTGILLKAKLTIQPQSNGNLYARISEAQYGQLHSELADGWNTHIPDSQVSYKQLSVSDKYFQIVMEHGVIRDLIVNKDVTNWEANIMKSIVSQFQLDTSAQNLIPSHVNTLPEGQNNNGVFKTMEDTINGQAETLYDIHPLPEYVLLSQPWLAPQQQLKGDGQVIEIVKSKNFTNSQQRPTFYYGLSGMGEWEPATNQMGEFFTRTSNSRVVVTGNLKRYTVQNSYTVNKIVMSPTLNDDKKGSVVSMLNVTLSEVRPQTEKPQELSSPVALGDLVYRFNKPYSTNQVRPQHRGQQASEQEQVRSSEEIHVAHPRLFRRSIEQQLRSEEQGQQQYRNMEDYWNEQQQQEEPKLEKAPQSPLLPYTVGYNGQSIKNAPNFNVVEKVQKIAQEIGQYVQQPETILEKFVLSRFTILTHLIRTMNADDLQKVSQKLYSQEQEGQKRVSWIAFRDAVAQSGTGPAFLTILEWIQSNKIQNEEAAEVFSTMTRNARQPTEEYIRKLFELIKSPQVESQLQLQQTAVLSFASLLHRVYVQERESHNDFPVHVFGRFRTQQGKQYMRETIIPYFRQQLEQAISEGNTQKIHTYILTLGNIGDRHILLAYEPYLEGQKQASQFQRLMMVVSMNKLAKARPELARSVLYKIYQNPGESQEVRIAAVYQLMRTSPPTDMLQRMAQYTHVDEQDNVNAAVKSSIETAAELMGEQFDNLRSSARAAKPLLTKKTFGIRQSNNYLRGYALDELKLAYKQVIQTIVGEGSFFPKSLKYSLHGTFGGLRNQLFTSQAMVSSIDELINLLEKQTEYYTQAREQSQKGEQHQWSSQHIAGLLNLKSEEKEQFEGFWNMDMGNIQKMFSFDNHTIEKLPKIISELEQELKQGKHYHHIKFMDIGEFVMAFPTEMGLPFVYTYNKPMLVQFHSEVKASAQPQLSQGDKLRRPETLSAQAEIRATLHGKTQGHISFVAPFENQQYIAGYDKVFLVHVPLRAKVEIDVKKQQIEAEFEPISEVAQKRESRLLHYSTWPFTTKADLLNTEPLALRQTTQTISQKLQQGFDKVLGQKETGIAFRVQYQHEQQRNNLLWLNKLIHTQDIAVLFKLLNNGVIERSQFNAYLLPQESTTKKVVLRLGFQNEYRSEGSEESNDSQSNDLNQVAQTADNSFARQQDFIKKVAAGIKSVNIKAVDAQVEFQGQQSIKYTITGAVAKSNVGPKSRVLFFYKADNQKSPFQVVFSAKSQIPNTNGLDLTESLKVEPQVNTNVKIAFGQSQLSSKIQAQIELRRSESRKQYLLEEPMYHQCRREMQEGNHQLPACANMTIRANKLDHVNIKIQHENLKPEFTRATKAMFNALRFGISVYPFVEVEQNQGQANQLEVQARFAPNLRAINVTVKTEEEQTTFKNILVNDWAQTIFVVQPVFHLQSRVVGQLLGFENYRQTCVIDETIANTFSNKSYQIKSLPNQWTVMMQYVQEKARQHQQPHANGQEEVKHQVENYLVLVRHNKENPRQKDVKITFNNPKTSGEVYEITMTPAQSGQQSGQSPRAKVFVGKQQVQINSQQSHDIQKDLVQIYALPNGEVKVEVRDNFYAIYDGERVKLTLLNGKFRDQVRGLCGQFNDQKSTDFLTPENCIVRNQREFIQSYNAEQQQKQQQRQHCYQQEVLYVNVISKQDVGQQQESLTRYGQPSDMCTKYQTRYVQLDGEICFTIRPMPVCNCQQRGTITKDVAVHCVQKSNVANLWKNQIDKGASPDFGSKSETRRHQMEFPQECSQ